MKKFGMLLMVLAIVAFTVATSQAALLSALSLDDGSGAVAANSVPAGPAGAVVGNPVWLSAANSAVGASALQFDGSGDWVDQGAGFVPNGAGMFTGTWSLWMKASSDDGNNLITARKGDSPNVGIYSYQGLHMYAKTDLRAGTLDFSTPFGNVYDGDWHLVTVSWNAATGAAGTGSGQFYVDGNATATTMVTNTITTGQTFGSPFDAGGIIGDCGGSGLPYASKAASFDDFASWSDRITDIDAKSLYNLGVSGLDYGDADAQKLWDLFAAGSGTAVVGGQTWSVASGLADPGNGIVGQNGAGGVGANYVVLNGNGGGVQVVPEPGTLSLLLAGAIGLLVFAWRKRK